MFPKEGFAGQKSQIVSGINFSEFHKLGIFGFFIRTNLHEILSKMIFYFASFCSLEKSLSFVD